MFLLPTQYYFIVVHFIVEIIILQLVIINRHIIIHEIILCFSGSNNTSMTMVTRQRMLLESYVPSNSQITNQLIELIKNQMWPNIKVRLYNTVGRGVEASDLVAKGSTICNYNGRLMTTDEMDNIVINASREDAILLSRCPL